MVSNVYLVGAERCLGPGRLEAPGDVVHVRPIQRAEVDGGPAPGPDRRIHRDVTEQPVVGRDLSSNPSFSMLVNVRGLSPTMASRGLRRRSRTPLSSSATKSSDLPESDRQVERRALRQAFDDGGVDAHP